MGRFRKRKRIISARADYKVATGPAITRLFFVPEGGFWPTGGVPCRSHRHEVKEFSCNPCIDKEPKEEH